MCRFVLYQGPEIPLADLVTRPRNSLINHSFDSEWREEAGDEGTAIIVSSEPLSDDPGWVEVPLNHLVVVRGQMAMVEAL